MAATSPDSRPMAANSDACASLSWRRLPPSTRITPPSSRRSSWLALIAASSTSTPAANENQNTTCTTVETWSAVLRTCLSTASTSITDRFGNAVTRLRVKRVCAGGTLTAVM